MKRRHVLMVSWAAVCGALAVGSLALDTEDGAVEAIIRKRLGYLQLDRRGVQDFARDYAERGLMAVTKLRALSSSRWIYRNTPRSWLGFFVPRMSFAEDRIVTAFLLSSDFFPGCDERRVVRYRGFFDGERRSNPFARLLAPAP